MTLQKIILKVFYHLKILVMQIELNMYNQMIRNLYYLSIQIKNIELSRSCQTIRNPYCLNIQKKECFYQVICIHKKDSYYITHQSVHACKASLKTFRFVSLFSLNLERLIELISMKKIKQRYLTMNLKYFNGGNEIK